MGSSIDMAVQQAAYAGLTVLRADYYCFDDSQYRHIPRGYLTDDGVHFTFYDSLEVHRDDPTRLDVTAMFAWQSDALVQALTQELATVRDQLHEALTCLGTYTTEFVGDERFAWFQLPSDRCLQDAGGYELVRGPLLNLGAGYSGRPLYGAQGEDAHCFDTPMIPLRATPLYVDRRRTRFRYRTPYSRPA